MTIRRLVLCLSLLAAYPAFAKQPPTVELPGQIVAQMRAILGEMPHDKVAGLVNAIDACISVQVPNDDGAIVDRGQCPPVSQARQARDGTHPQPGAPHAQTDSPPPAPIVPPATANGPAKASEDVPAK